MAEIKLHKGAKVPKPRKRNEQEARTAFRLSHHLDNRKMIKFADTRRCRTCGSIIPKAEDEPDYIVTSKDWFYLESKESVNGYFYPSGTGGFTEIQRRKLAEHPSLVFLVMTDTEGRAAYLFTYTAMLELEKKMQALGTESIRRKPTDQLLGLDFELKHICHCTWIPGADEVSGYWQCPDLAPETDPWIQLARPIF